MSKKSKKRKMKFSFLFLSLIVLKAWIICVESAVLGSCTMNLRRGIGGQKNTCGFEALERGKTTSPNLVGGAIHFAQTRSVQGGVSLRAVVDLQHVRSMHFDLLTCGERALTDTYVPIIFHSSFDQVRLLCCLYLCVCACVWFVLRVRAALRARRPRKFVNLFGRTVVRTVG